MENMKYRDAFCKELDAFTKETGMSRNQLAQQVVRDHKVIGRLINGSASLNMADRFRAKMTEILKQDGEQGSCPCCSSQASPAAGVNAFTENAQG
jgi:hypothetical protein